MAKHENSWALESGGGLCAHQNNLLESELIGNAIDCFFGFLLNLLMGRKPFSFQNFLEGGTAAPALE